MTDLTKWNPEDEQFWEKEGKSIATRNLWISIPSLLVGFSVWLMWGIITVQMKNLGFTFGKSGEEAMGLLFMLPAIAESNVFALIAMYALPLLTIATAVVLVLSGVQVRPPEAMVAFGEALLSRIVGTARGRAPAGSR